MIYFVSGHLDITREEFKLYYIPMLMVEMDISEFVIGDARGLDLMAQQFLATFSASVTVYHMFDTPRNNVGFPTVGGFQTDEERDKAMTINSDQDIAWVRPGRENSGTARNLSRRIIYGTK